MAQGLGMRVIFHDPALKSPIGNAIPATQKMIATRSDAVVLACNLSPENIGMIDRTFLRAMRPDSVLVNVARGALVRTQPLIEALQNGRIAGAALDVFETEPLPDDSVLRDLPNVILGSHNANNEKSAVEFVHRNSIANLMSALEPTRPLEEAH